MKMKDRVQAHTAERVNQRLHDEAQRRVLSAAGESERALSERIRRLDDTWDIERWLEMNASALAFTGVVLGLLWNRKWFAIPCWCSRFSFNTLSKAGVRRFHSATQGSSHAKGAGRREIRAQGITRRFYKGECELEGCSRAAADAWSAATV
jgi:hypothetical protein